MAITAYSKKFKRELDVKQLLDLYQQLPEDINHSEFIRTDIECPCCGTTGGRIISEGRSTKTNRVVKQAHFAFKNDNGLDTHLVFCDYYTGDDRDKKPSDESVINLSKSGSATTEAIRKLICTAIENDIFKQQDIRNMRSWFFEMRSTQDFKVEITKHHLNILGKTIIRNKRNHSEYIVDHNVINHENFDLDREVYESLATKFPYPDKIKNYDKIKNLKFNLTRKNIIKKAVSLSNKGYGVYEFDRSVLEEKYFLATKLSLEIINLHSIFYQKIGNSVYKARSNNPLMAYAAILLFVNEWNRERALEMHKRIADTTSASDGNLGNVVGLNPFIHYEAWTVLRFAAEWKEDYRDFDFEQEYLKEKARLSEIYQLS